MKNRIPDQSKFIMVLIILFVLIVGFLALYNKRKELYKEWLKKQSEIKELLKEQKRIIEKKLELEKFAHITMFVFKLFAIGILLLIAYFQIHIVKNDIVSGLVNASGLICLFYAIVASLLGKKVHGLNECQELIKESIIKYYYKLGKLQPDKLYEIELNIMKKQAEAHYMKNQLRLK